MDRASLQWVRTDIDESLKQACVNLETYASDPADVRQMLECAETLHGVQGVLEMLEVYGLSLLLDELEQLSRAVHVGEVTRREDACEILMQGIVQVPNYIDFVARGNRDNPIVLMPLLNDVRSVRGQSLLSENVLFTPDLDAKLPVRKRPVALHGEEFVAYVRTLRPHFQRGLVAWFRGADVPGALQTVESVLAHVQRLVGSSPSSRLWWVARAVVDALISGGLEQSTSIKRLVGQLDRELRRFVRDGDKATAEEGPQDLFKNLLYYCARSAPGGKRLETIRSAFGLDQLALTDRDLAGEAPTHPFGPDVDTLGTVTVALKDTLARIADALDTFNRTENKSISDFQPLMGMLQEVGDTLGLLGLGVPRRTVVEQQRVLTNILERHRLPDENQLMELAACLLKLEEALDKVADRGVAGDMTRVEELPPGEATQLSGIEYIQLVVSVVGEAKSDISFIKDAIAMFIADGKTNEKLVEIPDRARRIVGGMRMLFLEQAADLLGVWLVYVDRKLLHDDEFPGVRTLAAIAHGIESLEHYLESVAGPGDDVDSRLSHAQAVIEALPLVSPIDASSAFEAPETLVDIEAEQSEPEPRFAVPLESPVAGSETASQEAETEEEIGLVIDDAGRELEPYSVDAGALAGGADDASYLEFPPLLDDLASVASHELADENLAPFDDALTDDLPDALARSLMQARDLLDRMDEEQPENLVVEGIADEADEIPAAPTLEELALIQGFVMNDDSDEEIVDTFVAEADEVLEELGTSLPMWRADPSNLNVLAEVRRSFQTLEGNGRIIGAVTIGKLCWAIENLLDRVVAGVMPPTQPMIALVQEAVDGLPSLLQELRGEGVSGVDVPNLERRAEQLVEAGASAEPMPAADEAQSSESANEADSHEKNLLPGRGERVTVDAELLDKLAGYADEISISQSRIEQQVGAFRVNLDEMDQTIARLREQLRRLEVETESQVIYRRERDSVETTQHDDIDPLEFDRFSQMQELSRGLAKSVEELSHIRDLLGGLSRESEAILIQQARTNTDLQDGLTQTRKLPFGPSFADE